MPPTTVVGEILLFSKIRYGRTKKNVPLYRFLPLRPCLLPPTKVATTYGTTHGESNSVYAVVEYADDYLETGRSTVVEILGPL